MSEHEKAAEHPAITKLRAVEWRFAGGDASAVGTIALTGKEEAEREVRTLIAELEAVDVALRDCGFPEAPTRAERLRLASNAAECNADALALLEPERDRLAARVAELEEALRRIMWSFSVVAVPRESV